MEYPKKQQKQGGVVGVFAVIGAILVVVSLVSLYLTRQYMAHQSVAPTSAQKDKNGQTIHKGVLGQKQKEPTNTSPTKQAETPQKQSTQSESSSSTTTDQKTTQTPAATHDSQPAGSSTPTQQPAPTTGPKIGTIQSQQLLPQTGPLDAVAATLAVGSVMAVLIAYLRSRQRMKLF